MCIRDRCKENVIFFLAGELGLLLLNILCYGDMYWMIPEQVLMVPCFKILKERKNKKEQQLYQKGFQDLLQSCLLYTSDREGEWIEDGEEERRTNDR